MVKDEDQDKFKMKAKPVKFSVWRDIMNDSNMKNYPFAEVNYVDDLKFSS